MRGMMGGLRNGTRVRYWDVLNEVHQGTITGRRRQDGRMFYYVQAGDELIILRLPEHVEPIDA